MRKVTQNLLISIAICILSVSLAVIPTILLVGLDGGMEAVGDFFEQIWENGEVDTVEGHGAIIVGALGMLGIFGQMIIIGLLYFLSIFVTICLFLTLIARFVYAPRKGWRLITYRILMTILYLFQAVVVWFCFSLSTIEGIAPKVIFIPIGLLMVAGIIYSAINTYSERIMK